jgi:hypothetical protein
MCVIRNKDDVRDVKKLGIIYVIVVIVKIKYLVKKVEMY